MRRRPERAAPLNPWRERQPARRGRIGIVGKGQPSAGAYSEASLPFTLPHGGSTRYDRHDFAFASQPLLTVLDVLSSTPARAFSRPPPGLRLALTALSGTLPCHVARNKGFHTTRSRGTSRCAGHSGRAGACGLRRCRNRRSCRRIRVPGPSAVPSAGADSPCPR